MATTTQTQKIFIGRKPLRMYLGIATARLKTSSEVSVAARGNLISKAIIIAHLAASMGGGSVKYGITVDKVEDKEKGRDRLVPVVEAVITKST
jgi:DNA-binding protein Alba